mmetsp:Transcript_109091/g.260304  ORF Transcript_109091/g.260304 Transcript_109091/m.260304 type:complete len:109 (-) Transcript_109091:180-506(-)
MRRNGPRWRAPDGEVRDLAEKLGEASLTSNGSLPSKVRQVEIEMLHSRLLCTHCKSLEASGTCDGKVTCGTFSGGLGLAWVVRSAVKRCRVRRRASTNTPRVTAMRTQ